MTTHFNQRTIVVAASGLLFVAFTVTSYAKTFREVRGEVLNQCQGKFKGKTPTRQELQTVLSDHKAWAYEYAVNYHTQEAQSDSRRANLSGADLIDANLAGADLRGANLSGADLLTQDLRETSLTDADLSGANLGGANLSGVMLNGVNLKGANLLGANLSGVDFEPVDLPDADDISGAENLAKMVFGDSPQALYKLRKAFKDAGFFPQEREVTYSINHQGIRQSWWRGSKIDGSFRYVFFDLTTQWGMAPGRALLILVMLIPIFAVPYVIALHRPQGLSGIWRKWADDRVRKDLGVDEPVRLCLGWHWAFVVGLYFSVLSAFNIGWRELNVGNWIQRLQANEYTLRPTGWVRTVSGAQALISVYLLAICALTYFGRPFE